MSVSWGIQYSKLKANLRLAANRLKHLQSKKSEQAQKARIEIANFLDSSKEDRARIKVESIIREDFIVEAYELLEMFCELLLARFGIIQQMKELDDGIAEAVTSIFWAAPRVSHEISEFKVISEQLQQKYGKQFAEAARMNQLSEPSRASPKLLQKLSVTAPSKLLVEKYLVEIAKCAGVDFIPDPKVMRDDENEIVIAERNLINFLNESEIGWSVPPGGPSNSGGDTGTSHFGGKNETVMNPLPPKYPAPTDHKYSENLPPSSHNTQPQNQSPPPSYHNSAQIPDDYYSISDNVSQNIDINAPPHLNPPKSFTGENYIPKFPDPPADFPTVTDSNSNKPTTSSGKPNNDGDFDLLAKRFEELKKKM